jgi:hypothetical protein
MGATAAWRAPRIEGSSDIQLENYKCSILEHLLLTPYSSHLLQISKKAAFVRPSGWGTPGLTCGHILSCLWTAVFIWWLPFCLSK